MKKYVHIGAGNIGRGFIGKLIFDEGNELSFIDVDVAVIDKLSEDLAYNVHTLEENSVTSVVKIKNALNSVSNFEGCVELLKEADVITCSVGVGILKFLAPMIYQSLDQSSNKVIMACENAINATNVLKEEILLLGDVASGVNFVNTAVDRIVPAQSNTPITDVYVEPFYELVINSDELVHDINLTNAKFVADLAPYIKRKLFTVNTGHYVTAVLGKIGGYEFIYDAISDEDILGKVNRILGKIATGLCLEYGLDTDAQNEYVQTTISRFQNSYIKDDVVRVGRDPVRKLSKQDRIVEPILLLEKHDLDPSELYEIIFLVLSNLDVDSEIDIACKLSGLSRDKLASNFK